MPALECDTHPDINLLAARPIFYGHAFFLVGAAGAVGASLILLAFFVPLLL
jgi:hypothetical protein